MGVVAWLPILWRIATATDELWRLIVSAAGTLLVVASISAYLSLNFTGATTFTSRSGVRREMFRYIPTLAGSFVGGIAASVVMILV